MAPNDRWPELPLAAWQDTRDTLHLWTQAVGKVRLALTPWLNHSWHVALYVTARGLSTSPIPWKNGAFQIDFDFLDHVLWIRTSEGHFRQLMLKPMTVAEFYEDLMIALRELGIAVTINPMPAEIADCVPFDEDTAHAAYDADHGNYWHGINIAALLARAARDGVEVDGVGDPGAESVRIAQDVLDCFTIGCQSPQELDDLMTRIPAASVRG